MKISGRGRRRRALRELPVEGPRPGRGVVAQNRRSVHSRQEVLFSSGPGLDDRPACNVGAKRVPCASERPVPPFSPPPAPSPTQGWSQRRRHRASRSRNPGRLRGPRSIIWKPSRPDPALPRPCARPAATHPGCFTPGPREEGGVSGGAVALCIDTCVRVPVLFP